MDRLRHLIRSLSYHPRLLMGLIGASVLAVWLIVVGLVVGAPEDLPTPTLFLVPSETPTLRGPTPNPTATRTGTPSTPTITFTPTDTYTPSITPTWTSTNTLTPTITRTATATPTDTLTPTNTFTPSPTVPTRTPTFAPPRGMIPSGSFEFGGQTHTLSHPSDMRYAGMEWVKFQYKWHAGANPFEVAGLIASAKQRGFRVLLSIPGPENPNSIDYDAYTRFMAGVAGRGPDAIEIWNEPNLPDEWPRGQISGHTYVNQMLAPAYNAIKAADPRVMVISAAPAPTGGFGGCTPNGCDDLDFIRDMAAAGAGAYSDCIGVHFNSGATSPYATTGHPAGTHYTWYLRPMVDTYWDVFRKPLCFTELGVITSEGYGGLPQEFSWGSGTTLNQQAQWLADSATILSGDSRVPLMIVFNIDISSSGSDPQGAYAIIRGDGSCPACDALHRARP